MVFADSSALDMIPTSCFIAPLLTSESGTSPTCGFTPVFNRARCNRLPFPHSNELMPASGLLAECPGGFLLNYLIEILDCVGTAFGDDFMAAACAFRSRKTPRP